MRNAKARPAIAAVVCHADRSTVLPRVATEAVMSVPLDLLRRLTSAGVTFFVGETVLLPEEVAAFLADPLAWRANARGISRRILELWAATGYNYPAPHRREWPLREIAEILAFAELGGVDVQHVRLACGHDVLAHLPRNWRRWRCSGCHDTTLARLEAMVRL